MRTNDDVFNLVHGSQGLIRAKSAEINRHIDGAAKKVCRHGTELAKHASKVSYDNHVKTRKAVAETTASAVDMLNGAIETAARDNNDNHVKTRKAVAETTASAVHILGAKIDKIGGAGKSIGWIIFELIVAAGIIALGAWFFSGHCLVPVYDANWTLVDMVRDWHTWIITISAAVVWLIVAHWLIPAGYKKSK